MLLIRYTLVLATAIVGSAFAWFGPLAPFDDYGKLYELGLSGGTYYGYQYVPRHPGHANVPAKRADLNVSIAVKKPPIVRQAAPFLHGQGEPLHDFYTPVQQHYTKNFRHHAKFKTAEPVHNPLEKEAGVKALPKPQGIHGEESFQRPPPRKTSYHPSQPNLAHKDFYLPLPKDVGIHEAGPRVAFHKEVGLNGPILAPELIKQLGDVLNEVSTDILHHHDGSINPFVGKGQFNVVSRAFESTDARKLSKPFLTPVTRNNNGYAYHRVPLALGKSLIFLLCF